MKENKTPWAIFQIGLGLVCVLIGISGFILSAQFWLSLEALFLGVGVLLFGLTNNNTNKSDKGKTMSYTAYGFYILGVLLIFYNTFFT
jgi:hypothetical protein